MRWMSDGIPHRVRTRWNSRHGLEYSAISDKYKSNSVMPTVYFTKSRWSNFFIGAILLAVMFVLNLAVGWILFGNFGALFATGLLVFSLLTFPSIASQAVMRSYGAREISLHEAPELWQLFQRLTAAAGIKHVVELFYLPSSVPNAFAFGTDSNAAVCVSDGILRMMTARELAGILAHELAHIKNRDTSFMSLALVIRRVNGLLARIGLLVLFFGLPSFLMGGGGRGLLWAGVLLMAAPFVALLLELALSRAREFNADLTAAEITRDPLGLASALQKIESAIRRGHWWQSEIDPRTILREPTWLRTHPGTDERIKRLREIQKQIPPDVKPLLANREIHVVADSPRRRKKVSQVLLGSWR